MVLSPQQQGPHGMGNRVVLCVLAPEEGWKGQEGIQMSVVSAFTPRPRFLLSPGLDFVLVRAANVLVLPHLRALPLDRHATFLGSLSVARQGGL